MNHITQNRLIHSTSPYLLQHAHNPVDWYEWSEEALLKAKQEDKPILISIGYSSCHWCHVMERESFEVEEIAKVMNEFFVCIKVDREERPDIDQIYMEAVQALRVNGGWPLNVFLTPEQKPFFGGTYFSPQAWVQVLENINKAFRANRIQLEESAEELRLHLLRSDVERFKENINDTEWVSAIESVYNKLESKFDFQWGGMDKAPKFVMPSVWHFLLRYYHISKHEPTLEHVKLTLNKIAFGGIYDQIGGGFARYSVDGRWFAPHFEKMLYDNAQLISLYAEAYLLTKDEAYKTVVFETFQWLMREMTHEEGGFYSALDADSEGIEGQFYIWTKKELVEILGDDEAIISDYYSVTESGNWEHGKNILTRNASDEAFLRDHDIDPADWKNRLSNVKQKLMVHRNKRIRPGLDDKIITAWNAMMIGGLTDAYRAFGDQGFLAAAIKNIQFLERELASERLLFRSYKGKRSTTPGFLDDYAYVIQAYLKLYQVTFDETYVHRASGFITYALEDFFDTQESFFYYTSSSSEKLITRKKEIFDNVIPSSNAIMAQNLFHAGTLLDKQEWKTIATSMTSSLGKIIVSEPNYMSHWAIVYTEINKGMKEVLMLGQGIQEKRAQLQHDFHPFLLLQGSTGKSTLPLFDGKVMVNEKDSIFVCEHKTCGLPVHTLEDALEQIVQTSG